MSAEHTCGHERCPRRATDVGACTAEIIAAVRAGQTADCRRPAYGELLSIFDALDAAGLDWYSNEAEAGSSNRAKARASIQRDLDASPNGWTVNSWVGPASMFAMKRTPNGLSPIKVHRTDVLLEFGKGSEFTQLRIWVASDGTVFSERRGEEPREIGGWWGGKAWDGVWPNQEDASDDDARFFAQAVIKCFHALEDGVKS